MAQYQTGTVTLIQGNTTITGSGTEWLTYITAGDAFKVRGENTIYQVASIDTDAQITLSAAYAGTSKATQDYQITKDFTTYFDLGEVWSGDRDWAYHLTVNTIRKIDTLLRQAIAQPTVAIKADDYSIDLTDDMGEKFIMNAAVGKTFTLPSVTDADVGVQVFLGKMGAGTLTIAGTGTSINAGNNLHAQATGFAMAHLTLITSTIWLAEFTLGTWSVV